MHKVLPLKNLVDVNNKQQQMVIANVLYNLLYIFET
jgi:hypothetical protein